MKPIIFANKASTIFDRTLNNGQVYSDEDINTGGNIAANLYDTGFIPGKPISPILLNTVLKQISTVLCGVFAKVLDNISSSIADLCEQNIGPILDKNISDWTHPEPDTEIDTETDTEVAYIIKAISNYLNYISKIIDGTQIVPKAINADNYIGEEVTDDTEYLNPTTIKELLSQLCYRIKTEILEHPNNVLQPTSDKIVAKYYNTGTKDSPIRSEKTINEVLNDIYNRINK